MNNLSKIGVDVLQNIKNINNPLSQNSGNNNNEQVPSFSDMLKSSINEANRLQQEADKAIQELSAGGTQDVHQTMIALKKADISLQLMIQVRNKIVEAYQEVMRMTV